MGQLLDLFKAAAGQLQLSGALGRWAQAVSNFGDLATQSFQDTFSCPSTVQVNDTVYVSGANAVDRANGASGSTANPTIGFVTSKPTPTTCVVQFAGVLPNRFVGLVPGTIYYMGLTPGAIVPAGTIFPGGATIQQVGIAKNSTTLIAVIMGI